MTIWRRLGLLKWRLIDDLPYYPLKKMGERQRIELKDKIEKLPPLMRSENSGPEVHMLCGINHVDMAIWASWSLLRFLRGASLVVHSDGSLKEDHIKLWRTIVPHLTLVTKDEGDRSAENALGTRFPRLLEWRRRQFYGVKFLDFHFFGASDRIILLDSDVLFFSNPLELVEGLAKPESPFLWHEDNRSSYLAPTTVLENCIDARVEECVCAGFLLTKRWKISDLEFFEEVLEKMQVASLPIYHVWAEQTMYAIVGNRHNQASALSGQYSVYFGKTLQSSVMRHYAGVSKLRPRFYLEGVPLLLDQIDSHKKDAKPFSDAVSLDGLIDR